MRGFDPDRHHRRSIRLQGYDYARPGRYYVTLCVEGRICLFGDVRDGKMHLNDAGWVIERIWKTLPERFPGLEPDEYTVMPNHLHGILEITRRLTETLAAAPAQGMPKGTLPGSVGRIMQDFKTDATYEYAFGVRHYDWPPFERRLLQRSYFERIIRGERELAAVRAYIRNNPQRWAWDEENPGRDPSAPTDPPPLPDDGV